MKIISHRGNVTGIDLNRENCPEQIDYVLNLGYDVEVDLRVINNNFFLGHDFAQYRINLNWLIDRKDKLWIHLKNIDALYNMNNSLHYFWHENDKFTITSKGYIWSYPEFIKNSITVIKDKITFIPTNITGICTDHINFYENI